MMINNKIYMKEYVVKLTNKPVNGLLSIPSPNSTSSTSLLMFTYSMSSPSSITLYILLQFCLSSSYSVYCERRSLISISKLLLFLLIIFLL